MKKRKKLSEKGIVFVILAVIVVIAIIIGLIFDWSVFIPKEYKKPQFIITKEECSNFKSKGETSADLHYNDTIFVEDLVTFEIINFHLDKNVLAEDLCSRLINEDTIEVEEGCVIDFLDTYIYSDPNLVCVYFSECYHRDIIFHTNVIEKEFLDIIFDEPRFDHSLVYYNKTDNRIHNENTFFDVYIEYETSEEVCKQVKVKDNVIRWCYGDDNCGHVKIGEEPWEKDWLDENCKCVGYYTTGFLGSGNPNISKDVGERLIKDCKEGANFDGCDNGEIKRLKCSKYKCGDYTIEVK